MLEHRIKYTDFRGNEKEGTFLFNISKTELIDLYAESNGGFSEWLDEMIKSENLTELYSAFKKIVANSYGEVSEDGEHFIKSKEATDRFLQSAAFDQLWFDISTDAKFAADFVNSIIPQHLLEEVQKSQSQE